MARQLKGQDPKEAKPSKPKIVIFGRPSAGKTWASISWPSVYFVDTEGGANLPHYTDRLKSAGGLYLGPDQGANDFNVVIEEVVTLATTAHPFKTLVIDSFSKLFNTQIDLTYEQMAKAGRDMDKTFGAEKKPAIAYTRRLIRWFEKLDMNVILVCHEKSLWKDGKEIGVTADAWDKLEYELHLALHIVKTGNTRKARVTKTRLEQFPDAESFPWSYAEFAKRYGQDVMEADAVPMVLPTPAQVDELKELVSALKVDSELTDKWKEKAGVTSWEEMDADTIGKCIAFLRKSLPTVAA